MNEPVISERILPLDAGQGFPPLRTPFTIITNNFETGNHTFIGQLSEKVVANFLIYYLL